MHPDGAVVRLIAETAVTSEATVRRKNIVTISTKLSES